MTEEDKLNKIKLQEDLQKESDLKLVTKNSSKQVILDKLKITKEELKLLNDSLK